MDVETVAHRLGIGRDDLLELLEIFLQTSRADLGILEKALQDGAPGPAAAAAHSIKGAALNLELEEIGDLARSLETAAKQVLLVVAASRLPALKEELEKLARALSPPGSG